MLSVQLSRHFELQEICVDLLRRLPLQCVDYCVMVLQHTPSCEPWLMLLHLHDIVRGKQ